ncbi:MAG: ferric reductase-like transmembrane domain-containing protein [Weeksellaceae bacterium]
MQQSPLQPLFLWLVKNKQSIIKVWYTINMIIFLGIVAMTVFYLQQLYIPEFSTWGKRFGQFSVLLFCITITPGIMRRLQLKWKIKDIIMLFRRQLGIFTFIFAFIHYLTMSFLPTIVFKLPLLPVSSLQVMGLLSIYPMALVFFTSNDWSVKRLGKWWSRIHSLVYIIAWTIFFHVFLQGPLSVWGYLIGTYAILETASLLFAPYLRPKVTPPPVKPV